VAAISSLRRDASSNRPPIEILARSALLGSFGAKLCT